MLRFMLSQPSIERRSAMRLSISLGSSVGMAIPGSGTPSGPHRRRKSSNGSCGGWSGMDASFAIVEKLAHLGFAPGGVFVAQFDERAAEPLLKKEVAREVGARAVERSAGAQDEAHAARQLVEEARRDALQRLRRGDEEQLDRAQQRVLHRLGRYQRERPVDALHALDVHHQAVEEDTVQRVAG